MKIRFPNRIMTTASNAEVCEHAQKEPGLLGSLTRKSACGALLLITLVNSGCTSRHRVNGHRFKRIIAQRHGVVVPNEHVVVVDHQALPGDGFANHSQSIHHSSALDPNVNLHPPVPQVVNSVQTVPPNGALIEAWDQFENPQLRSLQEAAIGSATTVDEIVARLSESAEYGGRGLGNQPLQNASDVQRKLMQRVAETFVDIRLQQQLLTDNYLQLKVQRDALKVAEERKKSGKAGKLDIVALSSQVGFAESAMNPTRTQLRESLKRMSVLTGQVMTPPRIKSLAVQPQLSLPRLDDRLPATILRRRCDVRGAEQRIASMAAGHGIGEADLLPHLALQGELTAKFPGANGKRDRDDEFGLNIGEKETWGFYTPGTPSGNGSDFRSPLQRSMSDYQSTVLAAATDVEALLTEYHLTLQEVRTLEGAVENAQEAMRLALQQFEFDRVDGSVVASSAKRMYDVSQSLPQARAKLSSIAIKLFIAIGGECSLDRIPTATFYHRTDSMQ